MMRYVLLFRLSISTYQILDIIFRVENLNLPIDNYIWHGHVLLS